MGEGSGRALLPPLTVSRVTISPWEELPRPGARWTPSDSEQGSGSQRCLPRPQPPPTGKDLGRVL